MTAAETYDPATALVVVDVQNDFTDPSGGLAVADAEAILPEVNARVAACRAAGGLVAYTQDWHPPRTPHFATDGGPWPVHCVAGTWGAELHPDLVVDGPVVRKGVGGEDGYSGFSVRDPVSGEVDRTELGALLDAHGVRRVVVVGLAGDVCVAATAEDAATLGYAVTVPLAATRMVELHPGDGARAVERLRAAGVEVAGAP
ncbi:MAG: isochorismatase family protein [Nitriliruptoraceae bacterium]